MERMNDQLKQEIEEMGQRARAAAHRLGCLASDAKNGILRAMAQGLRAAEAEILAANREDVAAAEKRGLAAAMVDRLKIDRARLEAIAAAMEAVAELADPVGEVMETRQRPNGIVLEQVRVPIGVIGMIYESRPNVTADAAALCFKTGNATILRGGSEAVRTNRAIAEALVESGEGAGMPAGAIQLVGSTDREAVGILAGMDRWLDLLIPRGGKGLIETVVSLARMPVIKHYDGVCHLYVDAAADAEMAIQLIVDGKTDKPGVCNALETLLVDRELAKEFLPKIAAAMTALRVELRVCPEAREILGEEMVSKVEPDWVTEHLGLVLAIRVVNDLDAAVEHINGYGSHHTDVIVTNDRAAAAQFMLAVDSACVFHNMSSRFADGGEFGFGAEIGISTDKLHARGPMGLRELTSYQYRGFGTGQTRGARRAEGAQ